MAMAKGGAHSMLALMCLIIVLGLGCGTANAQRQQQQQDQTSCRLRRLNAQEPSQTIRSEGGVTELSTRYDNDELDCAGVEFVRETIETDCLSLPRYVNVPKLAYITEGQGQLGVIFPGCPESFRRSPFGEEEERECETRGGREGGRHGETEVERGESEVERISRRERDRAREESSQKVRRVQRGDVIAIPTGTAYWFYNDGDTRLRIVAVADSSSNQNQLDKRYRPFYLAGSSATRERRSGEGEVERREGEEREEEKIMGGNILAGFDPNMLAEAWGVNMETVRNVQENNQGRGLIIRIGRRLQTPPKVYNTNMIMSGDESDPNPGGDLGREHSFCSMRLRHNADRPDGADVYVRDGGRLNVVNRFKLHALAHLNLAAERGVLHPRAMYAPSWHACHSIMYATRGSARIQVVENRGRRVFDGTVQEGQFMVIPQMYAVVKKASEQGFEWITFTTCDSPMRSSFAGRNSVLKAMPQEVVANAFNITCNEAHNLRWNREHEDVIMPPLRQRSPRFSAMK